jgi:quercetin dioxygenase-like cupin family protein
LDPVTGEEIVMKNVRSGRVAGIGLLALTAVILCAAAAHALSFAFFVQGTLSDYGPFRETVNVEMYEITLSQGNVTGWHTHPGPTYVVVSKGVIVEDHGCGNTVEHAAGSAFFEDTGQVHNVANLRGEAAKLYIMQIVPLNTPDLTDVPPPVCP